MEDKLREINKQMQADQEHVNELLEKMWRKEQRAKFYKRLFNCAMLTLMAALAVILLTSVLTLVVK